MSRGRDGVFSSGDDGSGLEPVCYESVRSPLCGITTHCVFPGTPGWFPAQSAMDTLDFFPQIEYSYSIAVIVLMQFTSNEYPRVYLMTGVRESDLSRGRVAEILKWASLLCLWFVVQSRPRKKVLATILNPKVLTKVHLGSHGRPATEEWDPHSVWRSTGSLQTPQAAPQLIPADMPPNAWCPIGQVGLLDLIDLHTWCFSCNPILYRTAKNFRPQWRRQSRKSIVWKSGPWGIQ